MISKSNLPGGPQAAVAVIVTAEVNPEILVLKRAGNPLDPWSGHMALPGGRICAADTNLLQTCIRETWEECGLLLSPEQMKMPLAWLTAGNRMGAGTLVAPFLFEIQNKPLLSLNAKEIAGFHWLRLSHLSDPAHTGMGALNPYHPDELFPYVKMEADFLWGFTYGVLMGLPPLGLDGDKPALERPLP